MARLVMVPGYGQRIEKMSLPLVMRAADQIAIATKRKINNRTGELSRSVHARKQGRKSRVLIGTDHWRYYEYGTRPHVIRISHANVLTNGKLFYGKTVFHPGNRAFAPLRTALIQTRIR